jgi:hypothetical protein
MKNLLMIALMAAATLPAQNEALKGNYFFEESGLTQTGQTFHSVATLAFDGQGQLQGTQYWKGIGMVAQLKVRGNYTVEGRGGVVVMERQVLDPDAEGGVRFEAATYQVLRTADGGYQALRMDFGVLAEASMEPLANGAALKGEFAVVEKGSSVMNQSYVTLGSWSFDGHGNVMASMASRSFGVVASGVFNGRLSPLADGTFDLALTGATGEDNETPATVLNYKLIPNGRGFELLRVDSGIVAETSVSAR